MLTGQVFISHTSDMAAFPEGRSFVQAALDAVGRAGMAAVDMRYFAAREGASAEYCRQRVRECEVYVAVVGFRYGTAVPGKAVSYTELEFGEAGSAGLPRLVFLLAPTAHMPAGIADEDRRAVESFRHRLRDAGLVAREFSSAADLELEVFHALAQAAGMTGTGPAARGVRFSPPPDTAAFTGRAAELDQITGAVADATRAGRVVAIHAIGGMPGIGKTALAVHAIRRLAHRFPDRQLFIDLHAHTPGQDALTPADALAGLLAATGVDPRFLPSDLEGRVGLWRDRMAGQRSLLVLDNAASSAQVAPLLPGGEHCLVLVTSRRHLGDLPGLVTPLLLGALPAGEAAAMFTRLAPRAATDPAGVAEMVALAGCLPLAVSLLARVFARHPSWTLTDLAADTRAGLLSLAAEDSTIAAAFGLSYHHLNPAQRRFFDLLGLHPGTTTDRYAAAAMTGISLEETTDMLDGLHAEGLLTETGYRRYGMHDLLRRYARDHVTTYPDHGQALGRLLDYYQQTAALAGDFLVRQTRPALPRTTLAAAQRPVQVPVPVPVLEDAGQALAWVRAERDNLFACLDHATREHQHGSVTGLTAALAELLRHDGPWAEAIIRHTTALHSARHLNDQLGQANTLNNRGNLHRLAGDYQRAAGDLERALAIYRDLGNRLGQANTLTDLGTMRSMTGDYQRAAGDLEQALAIYRDLSDRLGQANTCLYLGTVGELTGDYRSAASDLKQALAIYRDLNSRFGQAMALLHLGALGSLRGDYRGSASDLEQALAIYREIGHRLGQANALLDLGVMRRETGDYRAAASDLEQALAVYREIGDRLGQANALTKLGTVRRETGDYRAAASDLEQALAICRDLGELGGETETLNEAGTLCRLRGKHDEARAHHQQALEVARSIGSARDEACALAGLGRCATATGHTAHATALLRQAYAIFRRIGAADAPAVLAELNATRPGH